MSENSLLQDFIAETGEHLEGTERNLLRLEQQPDDAEILNEIFRSVHTIKGSSEYLGMERIAELSHKLESLLDLMRRGDRTVDSGVIDLLMSCNDRIGVLVSELDQRQAEQSSIEDLVLRLKESTEQTAQGAEADSDDGVYGADEYDEELFGIFVDQLKEGLSGLSVDARQLRQGEDGAAVLERSADRLTTLKSSSNYMGYDELKKIYEQWAVAVEQVIASLKAGEKVDLKVFAQETMLANLEKVKALFPKVSFASMEAEADEQASAPAQEAESDADADADADAGTQDADQSLLAEFIAETGDHLEETERNLLRLEQQPDDVETLNEIFRSVHTIKGSSEYLGMVPIAELSHKLESLLDQMRRGDRTVDSGVIDLLMSCNDRISVLVSELDQHEGQQLPINDLLTQLDALLSASGDVTDTPDSEEKLVITDETGAVYAEEYDRELFAIFMEQLNVGLQELADETALIAEGKGLEAILERCIECLNRLRSSANYMEYDDLRDVYENWLRRLDDTLGIIKAGQEVDIESLNQEVMSANIERVKSFFSNLSPAIHIPEDEPLITEEESLHPADIEFETDINMVGELKTLSLDDFEDVVEDVSPTPWSSSDDDNLLLDKLASAFDSRLGSSTEMVKQAYNEHIENNLFSGDEDISIKGGLPSSAGHKQDDDNDDIVDVDDVESLLFSGPIEGDRAESENKLPEPVMASLPDKSEDRDLSDREDEDRRNRYKIGRRQTDKFRDRMLKQSIRVDAAKIDALMNQVGELVVSRSGFNQLFSEMRELQLVLKQSQKLDSKEMLAIKEITNRINEATTSLGRVTSELQENVMKVRMLPIAQLFSRYPRLVHDLVRSTQKKVNLEIYGEETELDKKVIEQLADPLVHIIRNAVDHGIEDAAARRQKGKNEIGTIRMEAYHESNYVVIEISDDGQGIDAVQIKKRALEKAYVNEEEAAAMSEEEMLTFIMRPGFSTAAEVTHTSGRGVGMDVVKDNIEKLNGTIEIFNSVGAGARFRIKIPLTLAIIPALLVRVINEIFTIPLATVDETIRVHKDELSTIEGMEVYYLRDNAIPVIRLSEVFDMAASDRIQDELFVVVVNAGAKQVGFVVDELKGRQEVVIKPLEDYLQEKSGFSGATILGDGNISLILDVFEMVQLSLDQHVSRTRAAAF